MSSIYFYFYCFAKECLKSRKKFPLARKIIPVGQDEAYEWAAALVGAYLFAHIIALIMILSLMMGVNPRAVAALHPKPFLIAFCFLMALASFYYYANKGRGKRIIEGFGARVDSKKNAYIGCAIFLEAGIVPTIAVALARSFFVK